MTTVRSERGIFKWKLGDLPNTTRPLQSPTFNKFSRNWKIVYRNGAILLQFEQGVDEIAVFVRYPRNRCMIIILQCDAPYRGHLTKVTAKYPPFRAREFD